MQELLFRLLVFVLCFTSSTARPRTWSGVVGGEELIFVKQVGQSHTVSPPPPPSGIRRSTTLRRREVPQGFKSFTVMTREKPTASNTADKIMLLSRSKRSVGTLEYRGPISRAFRVQGDEAFYLVPAPSSQTINLTTLNPTSSNRACFRIHIFDVIGSSNPNINRVIILETNNGNHHLHGNNAGDISLTQAANMSWTNNVTGTDHRLFRFYTPIGDNHFRIKHVLTDRYMQAQTDGVSLVQVNPSTASGVHFQMDPCTQAAAT